MDWAASMWKDGLPPLAVQKINQLEDQVERLQKTTQQKQFQFEQLEQAFTKQKQKVEEEKTQASKLNRTLQSLEESVGELQEKNQKLQHELQVKENLLQNHTAKFSSQENNENNRNRSSSEESEVTQLKATIDRLQSENRELKNSKSEAQLKGNNSMIDNYITDKLTTPARSRLSKDDQIEKIRAAKDLAEDKVVQLEQKLQQVTKELGCHRHNSEAAKASLEQKFKTKELEFKEEMKQHSEYARSIEKELDDIRNKLAQSQAQNKTIDTMKSQLEKDSHLQQANAEEIKRLESCVWDLEKGKQTLESQLAELKKTLQSSEKTNDALSSRLDGSEAKVKELTNNAKTLEQNLASRESELGKTVDALGEKEKLATHLKQQVDVLEQRCKSLENDSRIKLCSLEKELQEANSRLKELREASDQAIALQQQLQVVKEKTSNLEHCVAEKQSVIEKIGKELEIAKGNMEMKDLLADDLRKQLSDERNEVQKKADQAKQLQVDVERMNKTLADQQIMIKQLEGSVESATAKYQEKESRSKFLEEELAGRDATLQKVNRDLGEARRSLESQSSESKKRLEEECSKSHGLQMRVENVQCEAAELKTEVSKQKEELLKKDKEVQAAKNEAQSRFNEIRDLEKKLSSSTELSKDIEEKRKDALSEKAALEKELAEVKRSLEVEQSKAQKNLEEEHSRSRNLKNLVEKMETELDQLKSEVGELKDKLSEKEKELNLAKNDVQSKKKDIENLDQKVCDLTKLCKEKEAESKGVEDKLELVQKELSEAKRNVEDQDIKIKLVMEENSKVEKMQAEELQSKLSYIHELEQKVTTLTQLGNEMENRIKTAEDEKTALQEEFNDAKEKLETQTKDLRKMEEESAKSCDLQKQLENALVETADLKEQMEMQKACLEEKEALLTFLNTQLQTCQNDLQFKRKEIEKSVSALTLSCDAKDEKLAGLRSQMALLETTNAKNEDSIVQLEKKLQAVESNIEESGRKLDSSEKELASAKYAVESKIYELEALRIELNNVQAENAGTIKGLKEEVNSKMSELVSHQGELESCNSAMELLRSELQKKSVDHEELQKEMRSKVEEMQIEMSVTLEELERERASKFQLKEELEAVNEESTQAMLKLKKHISSLEEEVYDNTKKIQTTLAVVQGKYELAKSELELKTAEMDDLTIQLQGMQTESTATIEGLKEELDKASFGLASSREEVEAKTKQCLESMQKLTDLQSIQELNKNLQNEKDEIENLFRKEKEASHELQAMVDILEESKMKLQSEMDTLTAQLSEKEDLQSKYEALIKDKDNWSLSIEEERARYELLREELTSKNSVIKELEEKCVSLESIQGLNKNLQNEKDEIENLLRKEKEAADELRAMVDSLEESKMKLQTEMDSLLVQYSEKEDLHSKYEALTKDKDNWSLSIEEERARYELLREELTSKNSNFEKLESSLTELRTAMEEKDAALESKNISIEALTEEVQSLKDNKEVVRLQKELQDWSSRFDELFLELNKALEVEKECSKRLEVLDREQNSLRSELAELQSRRDELTCEKENLASHLDTEKKFSLQLKLKIKELSEVVDSKQKSAAQHKEDDLLELEKVLEMEVIKNQEISQENELLKLKIGFLKEEMKSLQDSLSAAKSEHDRVELLKQSIQQEKEQNLSLINQLKSVKQSITEIETQGDRLVAENDSLTKELTEKRLAIKSMTKTEENLKKQLDSDRSFATKLQQDYDALARELAEKRQKIKAMLDTEENQKSRLDSEKVVVAKLQIELDVARQNIRSNEEKIISYVNMMDQVERELSWENRPCKSCEELKALIEEEKNMSESLRRDLEAMKQENNNDSFASPIPSIKSELQTCHHVMAVELEESRSEILLLNDRVTVETENLRRKEDELQCARQQLDRLAGVTAYLSLIVDRHCEKEEQSPADDPCMSMLHRLDAELGHRTEPSIRTSPNCLNAMDDLIRELESALTKNTERLCLLREQIQTTREKIEGSWTSHDGGKPPGENGDCVSVLASPVSNIQALEREFSTLRALLARLKSFRHDQRCHVEVDSVASSKELPVLETQRVTALTKALEEEKSNHSVTIHESVILKTQLEDLKLAVEQLKHYGDGLRGEVEGLKKSEKSLRDNLHDKLNVISQLNSAIEEVENNLEEVFLEKNGLQNKIDTLLAEQKGLKEQIGCNSHLSCEEKEWEVNEIIKSLEAEKDRLKSELKDALDEKLHCKQLEEQILKLNSRVEEMDTEQKRLTEQIGCNSHASCEEKEREESEKIKSLEAEVDRLQSELNEALDKELECEELEAKNLELKGVVEEMGVLLEDRLKEYEQNVNDQKAENRARIKLLQDEIAKMEQESSEFKNKVEQLMEESSRKSQRLEEMNSEMVTLIETNRVELQAELQNDIKVEVAKAEELLKIAEESFQKEREELVLQLELARCKLNRSVEKREQLKVENKRLNDKLRVIEDGARELEIEIQRLDQLRTEHQVLKQFVDSAKEKLEEFNKMEERLWESEDLVSRLKTKATEGERSEKEVHELKSQVSRLKLELLDSTQKNTEFEGSEQLVSKLKDELADLSAAIERLNAEKGANDDALDALKIEVGRLKEENDTLQKDIGNFENEKIASKAAIEELNLRIKEETERRGACNARIEKLEGELEQRKTWSLELEKKMGKLQSTYEEKCCECQEIRKELENRISSLVIKATTSESELEVLKTRATEKETELAELRAKFEAKSSEWHQKETGLLTKIQEFEVNCEELRKEKDLNETSVNEMKAQLKGLQQCLDEETTEREISVRTIEDLRAELDRAALERYALDKKYEQSRDVRSSKVMELESTIKRLESELEGICEKCKQETQLLQTSRKTETDLRAALELKEEELRRALNKEAEFETALMGLLEKIRAREQSAAEKSSAAVNAIMEGVESLEKRIVELSKRLRKANEEIRACERRKMEKSDDVVVKEVGEDVGTFEKRILELNEQLREVKEEKMSFADIDGNAKKVEEMKVELQNLKDEKLELKGKILLANNMLKRSERERQKMHKQTLLELNKKEKPSSKCNCGTKIQELEMAKKELQKQVEVKEEDILKMWQEHGTLSRFLMNLQDENKGLKMRLKPNNKRKKEEEDRTPDAVRIRPGVRTRSKGRTPPAETVTSEFPGQIEQSSGPAAADPVQSRKKRVTRKQSKENINLAPCVSEKTLSKKRSSDGQVPCGGTGKSLSKRNKLDEVPKKNDISPGRLRSRNKSTEKKDLPDSRTRMKLEKTPADPKEASSGAAVNECATQ